MVIKGNPDKLYPIFKEYYGKDIFRILQYCGILKCFVLKQIIRKTGKAIFLKKSH